LNKIYPYHDNE